MWVGKIGHARGVALPCWHVCGHHPGGAMVPRQGDVLARSLGRTGRTGSTRTARVEDEMRRVIAAHTSLKGFVEVLVCFVWFRDVRGASVDEVLSGNAASFSHACFAMEDGCQHVPTGALDLGQFDLGQRVYSS